MAKQESKSVTKVDETKGFMTQEMPEFMKNVVQTGLEELDNSDYVMPIVKLMQATDMKVQEGLATAGDFYHLTSERNLGKKLVFIPTYVRKRFMLFRPSEDKSSGTNVLARADDGVHWSPANAVFDVKLKGKKESVKWSTKPTVAESGLDKFGSMDPDDPQSKPAATLIYDIVCILPEYPELSPAILSLKGSGVQKAKNFFTGLRSARAPIFGLLFEAYGTLEKNGNDAYQAHNIKGAGFVKSAELFKQGEDLNKLCSTQNFRADQDDEPENVPEGKINDKY